MKILVYGAGPLGSLMATRLIEAGHDVYVLARGQRLSDLREHGIVLEYGTSGERSVTRANVVESLSSDDYYDLVMVVMRKNHALQILPILAANTKVPTVLFMMNNAAGQEQLVEALGEQRVMIGFPYPGGRRAGHVMHVLRADERTKWTIPIGEVSGTITQRTRQVSEVLASMRGYNVEIRQDMDAWLKCHVALLMPALCPALYACGSSVERLCRTRDAMVLAVRGIKEAFRALTKAGISITPPKLKMLLWLPEPVIVGLVRRAASSPDLRLSAEGHAIAARDEMKHLTDEFLAYVSGVGAKTPVIDYLYRYFDPEAEHIPDGSAELPMNFGAVWVVFGFALCALGFFYFIR